MVNQTHKIWAIVVALQITFVTSSAFAQTPADLCANPVEVNLNAQVKMRFCEIPAAQGILIGSENGDSSELPVKPRNFKKFQIGQFEVTQLQYKTVTGAEPWKEKGKVKSYVQEGDNNPAVYISYYDAIAYADKLKQIDSSATYRLPTEAEFEYATRAHTNRTNPNLKETPYYWGEDIEANYAYYEANTRNSGQYARRVDSCPSDLLNSKYPGYCANDFGLYHMLGNVAEWTGDVYQDTYANVPTDGNEAVVDRQSIFRVVRGGVWCFNQKFLRASVRLSWSPEQRISFLGFRLVRIAK